MLKTLFEKIWDSHIVVDGDPAILYIDRHLVHDVTSPQAFEGLRMTGRKIRRPQLTFAVMDHNVPTTDRSLPIEDKISARQMEVLDANCAEFNVTLFDLASPDNGIVHVVAPQLGITLPGQVIVCGDSHTATHGALGSLAFGIGTSEVEHVLATQCLKQTKPSTFEIRIDGALAPGVTAKDLILAIIGRIGTAGGTGMVVEYTGSTIRSLDMDGRMTVCNMTIEAGARAGMISPDEVTCNYLKGRRYAPKGDDFETAAAYWKSLATDEGAVFDRLLVVQADEIEPQVSWGTSPGMVTGITDKVPVPSDFSDENKRRAAEDALSYMGLAPGMLIQDIKIDRVFIGSCTNGRLSDLIAAAGIIKGRKVADSVQAMVVPGSQRVKADAEAAGLDRIFMDAGFEWRESGCSMCLAMNADVLSSGERCASTSNRNFEGRQGKGSRTHLVSSVMAAGAAIAGHFVDVRDFI